MKKTTIPITLAALLTVSGAAAEEPQEEDKKDHQIFSGTIVSGQEEGASMDSIFDYRYTDGAQVTAEIINNPWAEEPSHLFNLGLKTPLLPLDHSRGLEYKYPAIRLGAAVDTTPTSKEWGYTGILDFVLGKEFKLRLGPIQNSEGLFGGFLGSKIEGEFFTIDFDTWGNNTAETIFTEEGGIHGYTAAVIPAGGKKKIYASLGGHRDSNNKDNDAINIVSGLINKGNFGILSKVSANIGKDAYNAKLVIAPEGSDYGRGFFDFSSHIYNNTEMRNVTTGNILDGWAPIDAFAVDGEKGHFAGVVNLASDEASKSAGVTGYYRPNKGLFFGVTVGDKYEKETEEHNPSVGIEAYAAIPNTPLESWVKVDRNFRTGQTDANVYFGGTHQF